MNPKLLEWYHNHPQNPKQWIMWILDTCAIGYMTEQLVGTFLELNTNNSLNPVFWTETNPALVKYLPILTFNFGFNNPVTSTSTFIGNHFITLLFINITFWYLAYKLNINVFWTLVLIFFGMSIHEWLWFISDYLYYLIHNIPFNLAWIEGAYTSIVQAVIIVFIFPWKFRIRDRHFWLFITSMFVIYGMWFAIGFPVTYDYTRIPYLMNGWVHGLEITTWIATLSLIVLFLSKTKVIVK